MRAERMCDDPLGMHGQTLGIMAPHAAQRAALQKDCAAYSGTVKNGKFLNVKDEPFCIFNPSIHDFMISYHRQAVNLS